MKKFLKLVPVVLIALALAACGESTDEPNTTNNMLDTNENGSEAGEIGNETETGNEEHGEPSNGNDDYFEYDSPRTPVTGILSNAERDFTEILVALNVGWSPELEKLIWDEVVAGEEKASMIHELLTTMNATEVLAPTHLESQQADSLFRITVTTAAGVQEVVYSVWDGGFFYRFTGTYGVHGDPGFVIGSSTELHALLTYILF